MFSAGPFMADFSRTGFMTATAKYVFIVSVDGLRSRDVTGADLQSVINAGNAPTFQRLQNEAAWTHNAQPDTVHTNTLSNHSSMITGRPVEDVVPGQVNGHRYRFNSDGEDLPTARSRPRA
jgi:predicted AlkP superfamily pyrophosphatase or phosphodiesterase